jgi:hypothetical protein
MSGRHVRLTPGRYTLAVEEGEGPAGLHRSNGHGEVVVDVDGGRIDFTVRDEEHAYYWWRGPRERPGVRLFGVSRADRKVGEEEAAWPTGTTG